MDLYTPGAGHTVLPVASAARSLSQYCCQHWLTIIYRRRDAETPSAPSGRIQCFGLSQYIQNVQERRGPSLLDGLSVHSEPIETRVFGMAPVRKNAKFHYLECSFRSFLKSKGRKRSTLITRTSPIPVTSPPKYLRVRSQAGI